MNYKEYLDILVKNLENDPSLGDLKVIYAKDDEGNAFNEIMIKDVTPGHFDGEYNGEFYSDGDILEDPDMDNEDFPINCICIN